MICPSTNKSPDQRCKLKFQTIVTYVRLTGPKTTTTKNSKGNYKIVCAVCAIKAVQVTARSSVERVRSHELVSIFVLSFFSCYIESADERQGLSHWIIGKSAARQANYINCRFLQSKNISVGRPTGISIFIDSYVVLIQYRVQLTNVVIIKSM